MLLRDAENVHFKECFKTLWAAISCSYWELLWELQCLRILVKLPFFFFWSIATIIASICIILYSSHSSWEKERSLWVWLQFISKEVPWNGIKGGKNLHRERANLPLKNLTLRCISSTHLLFAIIKNASDSKMKYVVRSFEKHTSFRAMLRLLRSGC